MDKNKHDINTFLIELKDGNMDSLTKVYLLTKKQVFAVCLGILKDRGLAEDAMQTTYVRIQEKIDYYNENTNGVAWVLTIARNISLNELKKNARVTATDFGENEYLTKTDDKQFDNMPIFKIAKEILNEEELEILMLYIVSGYKHREIADIVQKPLGTVLWSYNNSIKKLKKVLKDKEV